MAPKKKVLADHDDNADDAMDTDKGGASDVQKMDDSSKNDQSQERKKTATETYTKVRRPLSLSLNQLTISSAVAT